MTKCNEVIGGNSTCGKDICCFDCPNKDLCNDVCQTAKTEAALNCTERITEETALVNMKAAMQTVISGFTTLEIQKKALEAAEKDFREQLVKAMEKYGVKTFTSDTVSFTYVAATNRTTIDSKALKADLPDVAAKYSKTSPVKASVKITVKE